MLNLQLNWKSLLAFLFVSLLISEMHELTHIFTGYSFCGCWGPRDFNVWSLCEGCIEEKPYAIAATFAGPIFTFAIVWFGRFLLKGKDAQKKVLGFVLIFAGIPFARILTAAIGGGDEVYALRVIFENDSNGTIIWIIGLLIVLAASIPPLVTAWKAIANPKRIWYFLGFFLLPTFATLLIVLMGLNSILASGFLAESFIWGTPLFISLYTLALAILVWLTWKYLFDLAKTEEDELKSISTHHARQGS